MVLANMSLPLPAQVFQDPKLSPKECIEQLRYRLLHDTHGLMSDLYRFDLEERHFRAAMEAADPAAALFEALVRRAEQKIELRARYATES
jgi:hypothetical protein